MGLPPKIAKPNQTKPNQTALIVTPHGPNYGTTLQNYALKTAISSLGFDVENLRAPARKRSALMSNVFVSALKKAVKRILFAIGTRKYKAKIMYQRIWGARAGKFQSFDSKHNNKELLLTVDEALNPGNKKLFDKYAYVVAGSDMIWGHFGFKFTPKQLEYYHLTFADRAKRVNYAPSFGSASFTFEFPELRKELLSGFDRISCREAQGCRTIKRVTGFDAVHVLDPSMLLRAEDYRAVAQKPQYEVPEHYALLYIAFGGLPEARTAEYNHVITRAVHSLPAISIAFWDSKDDIDRSSAEIVSATGPAEFLWLIDHADVVLTNSFHGTVFSILFRKNFISMHRMNVADSAKIEDILSTLGLSSRLYHDDGIIPEQEIDYSSAYEKLEAMRESSMQYLRECLHVH